MKRRDIKKQLRKEAQQHTPDPYDKIVLSARAEGLLDDTENGEAYGRDVAVLAKSKKRYVVGIAAVLVAAVLFLAVALPLLLNRGKGDFPVSPKHIVLSTNDIYGIGAVSTVKLLGGNVSSGTAFRLSQRTAKGETASNRQEEVKSHAKKFNEYFTALDCFLGEDIVTTVSEANPDEKYPYETKLTIDSKNFDGESVRNIMYFTETPTDVDDDETAYSLVGILVTDGVEHYLEGERSIEQEDDETENELKIRAYADISDKSSYVEMEQEHSVEGDETETEYVYSIYSKGTLIEQTAVEFETEKEGNKEEVEYELEFRKGNAKGKYVIEKETVNGKSQIKVKYDLGGEQGKFHILPSGGKGYAYTFEDGTVLSF